VEIIAVGKDSKKNVDTFKTPIKIKIKYEEDKIFDWDEKALTLYYYDPDLLDWFPIETTVDTKNNTLTAYSDHLTVFDYKANNWQSQMVPTVDAFKTADFTGAGTYALNLWTPPAPGGLQPSVTLSYNSQVIDESSAFTQASWVSMGWDLDTGSITRNMHGTDQDFNDDTFSISAGGVSGLLLPISKDGDITTYNTADQSFIKVEGNDATYSFTAWTKDGTKYFFDKVDTANTNTNTGCAVQNNFTWRWSLSSVTDVHGNTMTYDYEVEKKVCTANGGVDGVNQIAVYPTTITYGNGKYSIAFIRESRTDYQTSWGTSSSRTLYGTKRLKEVRIKHDGQNVKRYVFSYAPDDSTNIYPNFTLSAGGKTLTLLGVQEFGSDGSSLPAVQFTYSDKMHLTAVDNGQGGSVTMTYAKWKYYDDVNPDIRSLITDFGAVNNECYGSIPTSWVRVGTTGQVRCDGGTGYLQVGNTPAVSSIAERSMPEHMVKPEATYNFRIDARAIAGTTGVKWGIKSGSASQMSPLTTIDTTGGDREAELTIPVSYNPTNIKLRLECASCFFREFEITQYPMLYRVTSRTVTVQPTGTQTTYEYKYDNASPTTVDNSAAAASGGTLYTQKLREFRGHAMTQVTDSASQLTTLSWFYQTDSFRGRLYDSLVLKRDGIYHDMEALDSANWTASSSGTHTASQIAQKDFDNSIKSVNANTNWNVSYTRATASVSDGEAAVAHVRLSGATAEGQVGLQGGTVITMSSAGATVNGQTLFDSTDFKKGEWYAVMFFVDAAHGHRVRMWQLDNPNQSAEVVISGLGAGPFKFYDSVKNGTIYLDAYTEGVPYSESITRYTKQVQYDTTTGGTYPDIASSTLMTFKDLVIAWVHPTYTENRNYNGDAAFVGTKQSYTYADAADYGNLLTQTESGNDGNGWVNYRTTNYEYYPKDTATIYIVSLPARQTTLAGDGSTVLGESYFYYDNRTQHTTPPLKGDLTMQRTWAGGTDYSQANFTYDSFGKPLTQSVYTEFGTLTTNPPAASKQTTTTAYDTDGYNTYPVSVTNELDQTVLTEYDYRFGLPDSVTDSNGITTSATYDGFGRMETITAPGDASPTLQVTYYDASIPFQIDLTQTVSASASIRLSRFYDGAGRQIQTQTVGAVVNGIQRNVVMDYLYDSAGRLVQQSPPRAIAFNDTPVFVTQSFTDSTITNYDILGRTLSVTQPNGNLVSYQYADLSTTVTDPKQVSTTSIMDVWGHTIHVIPPEGPELGYVYDVKGQLTKAIRGTSTEVSNCLTAPDTNCAASKTTTINYDVLGRKDDMIDPDMGYWDYEYDALGNLTFQTDARGCVLSLEYDDLNRLETKASSGDCGTQVNTSYTYDAGTNGIGRRTGMTDVSGSTTWSYDLRGRALNEVKTINGATGSFTTAWTYNSADLPITMTYPDSEVLTYGYNSDGSLNTVTSSLGSSTYLGGMKYDEARRIQSMDYGAGIIRKTFTYFDWSVSVQGGLLEKAVTKRLGDNFTLQSFEYAYDANANVETILDNQAGPQTQTFAYDSLNRILSASVTGGIEGLYSESYDYDDDTGNLSLKAGVGYTYSKDHPHAVASLSNGNSYDYDNNGNMTSRDINGDIFTLDYDAENRLVSVSSDSGASQPTATPTLEPTATNTPSATDTPISSPTGTETPSSTPEFTSTPTETSTPEITDTPTNAPEVTNTPSETLEPTATSTLEFTPTATLEATATSTPEYTSTPMVTLAITDTPASTPTLTPDTVTPETSTPAAPLPPTFSNATFIYNGDGMRVKSVMEASAGTETTYFPSASLRTGSGAHYQVVNDGTTQTILKYYYAGAQRIAMRTNGTLNFLLGDHLGSTSLVTDANGGNPIETRFTAWGEIRYSSGLSPTDYTYTGQFSYTADFGLMFYNARWYDSSLGRFAQADSIIPGGVQGLDRYAYVNNSPVRYTDPSGNIPCIDTDESGGCIKDPFWKPSNGATSPNYLDPTMLAKTKHGKKVYNLYKSLHEDKKGWWWKSYGGDGQFSIWDFIAMMYGYELDVIATDPYNYQKVYPDYMEAMVRNSREYCEVLGCDSSSAIGAFMHLSYYSQSTQGRAGSETPDMYKFGGNRITSGIDLVAAIRNPAGIGHPEWNEGFAPSRPYAVGNGSLFRYSPGSWLHKIGGENGDDPAYVLTGCQFLGAKGYDDLFTAWGCTSQ
jgi:RHS repeat-associated protein